MKPHTHHITPNGDDYLLHLKIDGEIICSLPFGFHDDADEFGRGWVHSNDRRAAMRRHPAGKRLREPHREIA